MDSPETPSLARPLAIAVTTGLLAALLAAVLTGAAAALALADPGPLVRWGLPLVSTVPTLAASATVGQLGLAAVHVPARICATMLTRLRPAFRTSSKTSVSASRSS